MSPDTTPKMRPSRVLERLRAGELARCFKINLPDVRTAQIAAMAGFDCLWTCTEHVPNDFHVVEAQILAAKAHDVDVVCRVPRGGYCEYIRPLELDAAGLMVPHVMSLEDAREIVRMTRFHPVGRRAVDGGNADGAFCAVPFADYLQQANRERFIILQIEDPEPLEELDAIADLPGYDILFFGPGDFSHSIGHPGEMDHPQIHRARERVAEAARKYGKYAGTITSPENIGAMVDLGYSFLSVGADVVGLGQYCRQVAEAFGIGGETEFKPYGGKS
jgi:4-hydroxy-2-oxoheptanedioate aldolase